MKKLILVTQLMCLAVFSACSIETSIEPHSHRSKLLVNVQGNNSNGTISEGGYLTIEIIGEDYDGISSIDLRILAIGIDQEFVNYSSNEHWEINQTFDIDEIYPDEPREIYVTLTDDEGNLYPRTLRLRVDE
ncbi:hypothetical protein [Aquimarina sediminis]|uniref:hypothetical protein n=1 Tax=Aquimarina sediminis TaxID=2070536 RepID=UPI000CA0884F|nr:hypothetical protein [Aquimarina sediminis]